MHDDLELLPAPASWNVTIPTDDASIVRRRRALAPIQVLTDIERNKSQYDGDFWRRYDLFNIALAVIDQVALAMGISVGRTWDETVDYAATQASRQAPGAERAEWTAVAERVVVSLVTTDVENVPYLVHTEEGPQWRAQRFRLLYVHAGGEDGQEYLRASEQAINIFVEALDLDIEAAQIANEAQLSALIARGAVESAVQIARLARYQSIQYQERVRRIVADTLIDPDTHDWLGDVPQLLNSALTHVRDRLEAEGVLLDAVAERRSRMEDPGRVTAANQLVEILRECRHRHNELHGHLIGARGRLREALDDRFARPPHAVHRAVVSSDLLNPFLARPIRDSGVATVRLLAHVGGIAARWWPSMSTLTDELCAPPRIPDLGEEFVDPEFDDDEPELWWEPYESAVKSILDGIDEPTRLAQLLGRAEELAAAVSDLDGEPLDSGLLVAATVHAAHRAWATRLSGRSVGDRVVVAAASGAEIDEYGVHAADLILVPGVVTADIDAPADEHIDNGEIDTGAAGVDISEEAIA
ncbi:hypothetical protein [Mycobacterium sp.]|uniref:hypothetical protein n=1 Tax=Mycobacterium sp. TaxID=1785 RepID=UPI002614520D|nr:hypothetical protein [Mycobacterium sp.]